jgi:twitching motility protein PilT
MSEKQPVPLIGRLAIQCKMMTMEQLQEATRVQGRDPERRLGDIFVELGFVDEAQIRKLKKLQRDLVIKHRARQAASGRAVPPAVPPRERQSEPPAQQQPAPEPQPAAPIELETAPVSAPVPELAQPSQAQSVDAKPAPLSVTKPVEPAPSETPKPPQTAAKAPVAPVETDEDEGESLGLSIVVSTQTDVDQLHAVLRDAVSLGASDIHLHSGAPSKFRINGELQEVSGSHAEPAATERMVSATLTEAQRAELNRVGELDLCYDVDGVGRFRTNIYRQQRGFDAVYRAIPADPPTLDQLGLPSALAKHTNYHQGMVLITGPAGCGKSSTMAALVNLINEERDEHILTIEDPIEYVHPSKRCLVNQRHAGRHTSSFARALRSALREDPDVIVIGELRDLETISLAMTAAETGHFVLATLHTSSAVRTISRMIGAFPSNQQGQVRTMLSESLRCVISQRLVVAADGSGRLPALEMLVINKAIANLIRDEKTIQIRSAIQTGGSYGMYLLEQSLNELVSSGQIERDLALRIAEDPKLITAGS